MSLHYCIMFVLFIVKGSGVPTIHIRTEGTPGGLVDTPSAELKAEKHQSHREKILRSGSQTFSASDSSADECNSSPQNEPLMEDISLLARQLPRAVSCKFQENIKSCDNSKTSSNRYYYDVQTEECRSFQYGHCGDNGNLFETIKQCKELCRDAVNDPLPDNLPQIAVCNLQPEFGNCHKYFPSFYYNVSTSKCRGFSWSGCGGNENRFQKMSDCILTCGQKSRDRPNSCGSNGRL